MTEARSIPAGASGVVAGNAWISGAHARLLLELIGHPWRLRFTQQRIPVEDFPALAEAVAALQAATISARENAITQAKRDEQPFAEWMTPKQLADAAGLTPGRIGQLRRRGELEGVEVSTDRWLYPPSAVEQLQNRRAA